MRTGRRVKNRISDDRGMSLVELIVVISIMAVMTGILSLGIGMMFSRDANYVAVRIDDALTETRTCSMSKDGTFTCELNIDSSSNGNGSFVQIMQSISGGTPTEYKKILLDKSVVIKVDADGTDITADKITFEFDKSKGSLKKVNGAVTSAGVYTIEVTSKKNSSKVKEITLISTTGRHYTDK